MRGCAVIKIIGPRVSRDITNCDVKLVLSPPQRSTRLVNPTQGTRTLPPISDDRGYLTEPTIVVAMDVVTRDARRRGSKLDDSDVISVVFVPVLAGMDDVLGSLEGYWTTVKSHVCGDDVQWDAGVFLIKNMGGCQDISTRVRGSIKKRT